MHGDKQHPYFETATGLLSEREAGAQIAIIPLALAAAAVLFALIYVLTF